MPTNNISDGLALSEISTSNDIFYFGGEPLIPSGIPWPISANGNSMNHVFTISTSLINKYTNLFSPENKVISIFSDNSYIGDLCESPDIVEKHFSKIILSNPKESTHPTPGDIEAYPKRYLNTIKNTDGSFIGGKPQWLQQANINKRGDMDVLKDYTFLLQFQGTEITESIGKRIDQNGSWFFTNNIFEDSVLYIYIHNEYVKNEPIGVFSLQMT